MQQTGAIASFSCCSGDGIVICEVLLDITD
jgi:hypothetical protein